MAKDLKSGRLVGALPRYQLGGQLLGSIFGAFVSIGLYKLFTSTYEAPGKFIQIPAAFMDVRLAQLLTHGKGIPEGAPHYAIIFGSIFGVISIIQLCFEGAWWVALIPGGVSFANGRSAPRGCEYELMRVGIFNVPSFSFARVLGGIFSWLYCRRRPEGRYKLMIGASGLVIGESLAGLVKLAMKAASVPHL